MRHDHHAGVLEQGFVYVGVGGRVAHLVDSRVVTGGETVEVAALEDVGFCR